jgi:hypothetical protein
MEKLSTSTTTPPLVLCSVMLLYFLNTIKFLIPRIFNPEGQKKNGRYELEPATSHVKSLTTTTRPLWYLLRFDNSLFHIPTERVSGPCGNTGMVKLLH